jgi:hypothetical protein
VGVPILEKMVGNSHGGNTPAVNTGGGEISRTAGAMAYNINFKSAANAKVRTGGFKSSLN